jgi:transcriptional regulator with XRE-family HTH domain
MEKKIHQGRNVARFRQIFGMKQDALASAMGDDWTQMKISRLEAKEEIEPQILDEVARALKVPVDAIKNFDEDSAINIISNTVNNSDTAKGDISGASGSGTNYQCTFNPLDRYVEAMEKNEKLYEALLKSEREKIALMEQMMRERK